MKLSSFFMLFLLFFTVSGHCLAQVLQEPWRDQFYSSKLTTDMNMGMSEDAMSGILPVPNMETHSSDEEYGTDTMSELQRLFHTSFAEDEPENAVLLRKALLALPLIGRDNITQLCLRPEKDIYLTIFKNFAVRKFVNSVHVVIPKDCLAIDTHVHTCYSHDSLADPFKMLLSAAARGLSGVAITDHDNLEGARKAQQIASHMIRDHKLPADFLVIPGEEISSTKGHIIGLFLTETIPPGMTPQETIQAIHKQGGLAVAAHPLLPDSLGDLAASLPFDAVESANAAEKLHYAFAKDAVCNQHLDFYNKITAPKLGASDAHDPPSVGMCYTVVMCIPTLQAVHDAIIAGHVTATTGMPEDDLKVLSRNGFPKMLKILESTKTPGLLLGKFMHADKCNLSFYPHPSIQLRWSRRF